MGVLPNSKREKKAPGYYLWTKSFSFMRDTWRYPAFGHTQTMNVAAPEGRPGGDSVTTQYFHKDLSFNTHIQNSGQAKINDPDRFLYS